MKTAIPKSEDQLNCFMFPFNNHQNFFKGALKLREEFDLVFSNPNDFNPKRFIWDYWHMPGRYHHLRTPAHHFFSEKNYNQFHNYLVEWGRKNLGCHNISMPVLSCYPNGSYQRIHADVPHGPWAFVFSLTKNHKKFEGGETFILKDSTLNYWSNFKEQNNREVDSFQHTIPSKFNQLTVFDPRRPHGVTEVKGPEDVCDSRLVIHGWFINPRPYVVGGLTANQAHKALQNAFVNFDAFLSAEAALHGCVAIRIKVTADGRVTKLQFISSSLIDTNDATRRFNQLYKNLESSLKSVKFPKVKLSSEITIPISFQ